jgi:hypothetical protein
MNPALLPPHAHDSHAAVHGAQHQRMPRHRGHNAVGREAFDDEASERRVPQIVCDACDEIDLTVEIDINIVT